MLCQVPIWLKTELLVKSITQLSSLFHSISSANNQVETWGTNLKFRCNPFPAKIFLVQSPQWNTRRKCEICSKLTIKTPEQRHWRCSGVLNVNFEHVSHLFLMFLLYNFCPGNIYLFKVNNENTKKRCEISSNLTLVYF